MLKSYLHVLNLLNALGNQPGFIRWNAPIETFDKWQKAQPRILKRSYSNWQWLFYDAWLQMKCWRCIESPCSVFPTCQSLYFFQVLVFPVLFGKNRTMMANSPEMSYFIKYFLDLSRNYVDTKSHIQTPINSSRNVSIWKMSAKQKLYFYH